MSTAFPKPAPGRNSGSMKGHEGAQVSGSGPMTVPADKLRHVLGVTSLNFIAGNHRLALVDTPLG